MGFVSMDPTYIQILITSGTPEQQAMAKSVKPFVDRHHLTLVTLLLGNASPWSLTSCYHLGGPLSCL